MQITCPACAAVYEAPDDAVPEDGRMVRCSACRAEWRARRPGADAGAPPSQRGADPAETAPTAAAPALAASRDLRPAPAPAAPAPAQPTAPAPPRPRADPPPPMLASLEEEPEAARPRSGFLIGFAVTAVLCLGAVALYARHDAAAAAVPQLAEPIARYVETVDRGREALAELVARGRAALEQATGG